MQMALIPVLGKPRQEKLCVFKDSLVYVASSRTAGLHRKALPQKKQKQTNKPKERRRRRRKEEEKGGGRRGRVGRGEGGGGRRREEEEEEEAARRTCIQAMRKGNYTDLYI